MKKIKFILALIFLVLLAVFQITCGGGGGGGSSPPAPSAASGIVDSSGGTILVTDTNSPIYRTKVVVPAGAINSGDVANITIKYQDNLPGPMDAEPGVNVVTARKVILVSKDLPYNFEIPVYITIPYTDAQMDSGDLPGIFYWSAMYNKYVAAGIKAVDTTNRTITFTTNHFSPFVALGVKGLMKSFTRTDSGFRAGTDGFFHPNFGAYDSPGGCCLGMANYSIWYYAYKKAASGSGGLYDKYRQGDPAKWEDDTNVRELISRAFIASSQYWAKMWMQTDYKIGSGLTGFFLITAMKITKSPVTFLMADKWPGMQSGHATVAYKYDPTSGKFYIYDNNFPAEEVTIDWTFTDGFANYSKNPAYSPQFTQFSFEGFPTSAEVSSYEGFYNGIENGWSSSKFVTINITSPTLDPSNAAEVPGPDVTVSGTCTGGILQTKYIVYRVNAGQGLRINVDNSGNFTFTLKNIADQISIQLVATDDWKNKWNAYAGYKEITIKKKGTSFFKNLGFETGNFTAWYSERHLWPSQTPENVVPSDKSAVVGPGMDSIATTIPMVYKGNYAVRVNNSDFNYHISSVSQSAVVPNVKNPQLRIYWAAVLQDPNHNPGDQPYVDIKVEDTTAGTTLYQKHFYTNDPSYTGWLPFSGGSWKAIPWQTVTLNFAATDIGHTIKITVTGADCALGGHGGYVYLDGDE